MAKSSAASPKSKLKQKPKRHADRSNPIASDLHPIALFAFAFFQLFLAMIMVGLIVTHVILYAYMYKREWASRRGQSKSLTGRELVLVVGAGIDLVAAALGIVGARRSIKNKLVMIHFIMNVISTIFDLIMILYASIYLIPKDNEDFAALKSYAIKRLLSALVLIVILFLAFAVMHAISCIVWASYYWFFVGIIRNKSKHDRKSHDSPPATFSPSDLLDALLPPSKPSPPSQIRISELPKAQLGHRMEDEEVVFDGQKMAPDATKSAMSKKSCSKGKRSPKSSI